MVAALERRLAGCDVRTGVTLRALRREGGTFQLALSDGAVLAADAVVLATPAYAAAAAVADLDPALANLLAGIPFVSVATVSVALPRAAVPRALEGYGYVIPRADGGPVVACTWTSSKFPDRAPPGFALLRYFLGRAGAEEVVAADDAALRAVVREELARVLGVRTEPALWRIHRWPRAMPQYVLGHLARVEAITRRLLELPGLDLAGASYRGVGLPDCIASGWAAADRVAPRARSRAA
jgi:oxygen-dependent protoporphyrinogen oxidase